MALEACLLLGVQPAEAAVFGDATADMQMARFAGVACAVVVTGFINYDAYKSFI